MCTISSKSAVRPALACAVLMMSMPADGAAAEAAVERGTYKAVRVFDEVPLEGAYRFAPYGDGFLVLDRFNHRLIELDAGGSIARQFGQVGQGPGELRFPMDYSAAASDAIRIVAPMGLFMVHSFAPDGEFLGVVHQGSSAEEAEAWASLTIAADSRGRYYLNQPRQGSVLSRYSGDAGNPTAVGELLSPGSVFEDCESHSRCRNPRFAIRLNRAVLSVAADDSVIVGFTAAPVVRRYAASGELEFETVIQGGLIEELLPMAMGDRDSWTPYIAGTNIGSDNVSALTMLYGVAVDPRSGLVYCLVGGKELHVLSMSGDRLAILRPEDEDGKGFGSVTVVDGSAWLTRYSELYRAQLPVIGSGSSAWEHDPE